MTNKYKLEIILADIIKNRLAEDIGDCEADITAECIVEFLEKNYSFDPESPTTELKISWEK